MVAQGLSCSGQGAILQPSLAKSSRPRLLAARDRSLHKRSNSLLFDFEEVVDCEEGSRPRAAVPREFQSALASAQRELKEVWRHAQVARDRALDLSTGDVDLAKFAAALARRGHRVWLRCSAQRGPCAGRRVYTFCVLEQPGGQFLVVDPNFTEQFAVAAAPDSYNALLQLLPPVFVGTAEHVNVFTTLLCSEVAKVFELKGLACPPWRTKKTMLSKWLLSSTVDVLVE